MADKNDKVITALFTLLGALMFIPVMVTYTTLLYGWALVKLWAWFVVPTFGLAPLSLPIACGLDVIVSLLRGAQPETKKDADYSAGMEIMKSLMRSTFLVALCLLIGWAIKTVWL